MEIVQNCVILIIALGILVHVGAPRPKLLVVMLTAFCIRAGLAFIDTYVTPLPDTGVDAIGFDQRAWIWAGYGIDGMVAYIGEGAELYTGIVSLIYLVFGHNTFIPRLLNVVLGTLVILNVYKCCELLWGEQAARKNVWVIAVFPSLCLYSSIILREAPFVYFLTLGAFYLIRWRQRGNGRDMVRSALAFFLSTSFHSGAISAVIILSLVGGIHVWRVALPLRHGRVRLRLLSTIAAVAVILSLSYFVIATGWGLGKYNGLFQSGDTLSPYESFKAVSEQHSMRARGRAVYLESFRLSDPFSMVWQVPLVTSYFLLAPFPWMISTRLDVIGAIDSMLYFILILAIFRSRRTIVRNPSAVSLALVTAGLVFVFAFGTSNYGTALRHRAKLAPLFVCLVPLGGVNQESNQNIRRRPKKRRRWNELPISN